jgi:hypothetical protein
MPCKAEMKKVVIALVYLCYQPSDALRVKANKLNFQQLLAKICLGLSRSKYELCR